MDTTIPIEATHALSPLQEGILFDSINASRPGMYFEQTVFALRGTLDEPALKRAWQCVVDRHTALRTRFVWEGQETPHQEVLERIQIEWERLDWSALPASARGPALDRWLEHDRHAGFALSSRPPLRLAVIRVEPELHHLALSSHHILLDRWSIGIVVSEVLTAYHALRRGAVPALPGVRSYREYIDWLGRQDVRKAARFWQELLKGVDRPPSVVDVCGDRRGAAGPPGTGEIDVLLPRELTAAVSALARSKRVTPNVALQAAWALLLSRYTGSDDVVYGVVVSGRPPDLAGVTSIVGLFINTLPMRIQVRPFEPASTLLPRLQSRQLQIGRYEYSSLVDIKAACDVDSAAALFDTLFVFQNLPAPAGREAPTPDDRDRDRSRGLWVGTVTTRSDTNYPLVLIAVPGEQLLLRFRYDRSRLRDSLVRQMGAHLTEILSTFCTSTDAPLGRLTILTPSEQDRMLRGWNDTDCASPDRPVHELIADQALRTPDAIAVACGERTLTYGELARRGRRTAAYLRRHGVRAETPVPVLVGRSIDLLPALLGVLEAGGAYVPLDPDWPLERSARIIEDAHAPLAIVDRFRVPVLPDCAGCEWLDAAAVLPDGDADAAAGVVSPDQAAYVIYTSGSTGRPKGVVVPHRGLSNYLAWCSSAYPATGGRGSLVGSPVVFDLAITGLFLPLLAGLTVQLIPDELGPEAMATMIERSGDFSLVKLTPAYLDVLSTQVRSRRAGATRAFVIGGEALQEATAALWMREAPQTALFNEYGPTETVVGCCVHRVTADDLRDGDDVPIGRPIANTSLYVLDGQLQPVPPGVPGELYIGGIGVARGYLREPALTATRFVADPFTSRPGARVYRTGDRVRYREDATLEYLGRLDDQVKIRGFRVELGEVAAVLRDYAGVEHAVAVAATSGGESQIIAYVGLPNGAAGERELTEFLRARLPGYMVPARVIRLPRLPLTPNGKVDRRALPDAASAERPTLAYAAPRSAAEERLAGMWADVLKRDRVGIDDNFFALGGHSLKIFQLSARVQAAFGVKLPVRAFFDAPTVALQAVAIARKQAEIAGESRAAARTVASDLRVS